MQWMTSAILSPRCCIPIRSLRLRWSAGGQAGKEETFRCRFGKVYLYTDGDQSAKKEEIQISLPPTDVSVFHETVLLPGEQFTIVPETLHWFAAGEEGAVISEFSTRSTDETDVFTDARIVREATIEND